MGGRQYRPVTRVETSGQDAMGIRAARAQAENLENAHDHVLAYKLVCVAGNPAVESPNSSTDELMLLYLGKHYLEDGLPTLRVWHNTKRTAGADDTTWKLVVDDGWLYRADEVYDSNVFANAKSVTWTTSSDDHVLDTTTLDVGALAGRWVWLYLTAANDTESDRASLYTLDIQLEAA